MDSTACNVVVVHHRHHKWSSSPKNQTTYVAGLPCLRIFLEWLRYTISPPPTKASKSCHASTSRPKQRSPKPPPRRWLPESSSDSDSSAESQGRPPVETGPPHGIEAVSVAGNRDRALHPHGASHLCCDHSGPSISCRDRSGIGVQRHDTTR